MLIFHLYSEYLIEIIVTEVEGSNTISNAWWCNLWSNEISNDISLQLKRSEPIFCVWSRVCGILLGPKFDI